MGNEAPADAERSADGTGARACTLREHRPGDLGWVLARHAEHYTENHGFEPPFEALVAEIIAGFARSFDPRRERLWIAEINGQRVGSIAMMRSSEGAGVGQLRLLLVEPSARGAGVGAALVGACLRFARDVGFERVRLETESSLEAACRLYARFGFERTERKRNDLFSVRGRSSTIEVWHCDLGETATNT